MHRTESRPRGRFKHVDLDNPNRGHSYSPGSMGGHRARDFAATPSSYEENHSASNDGKISLNNIRGSYDDDRSDTASRQFRGGFQSRRVGSM